MIQTDSTASKAASPATTLPQLLQRLETFGDAPALIAFSEDGRAEISYADLTRKARCLAGGLIERDVTPGDPVAVFATNSIGWVVCRFALILADALCVPVDYDADARRLGQILDNSGARLLFTSAKMWATARGALDQLDDTVEVFLVDGADGAAADVPTVDALMGEPVAEIPPARADAAVSQFYTSGTTGTPKAVPLSHENLLTNLQVLRELNLAGPKDRILLPLPLHHSYPFLVGLLLPLATGATVVFPAGVSGPLLRQALVEAKVTTIVGVPRLYEALVAAIDARTRGQGIVVNAVLGPLVALSLFVRRRLGLRLGRWLLKPVHSQLAPSLRLLASGGARLDPDVGWRLEGLGYQVLSGYGLVETSSMATFNPPGAARMASAGKPHHAVEMRIQPVEEMEHGEIQFRGRIVFAGYRNNPEANADAFTDDGWFRTGDLGWQDDDGYLYIAGRLKEIIVLPGGKNVSPEDVESVYGQSPYVKEVAVLERDERLVALVVPDVEAVRQAGVTDVERHVQVSLAEMGQKLPRYMRIAESVLVRDPLPRNQLGKCRRHALADIFERAERGERPEPRALTEAEKQRMSTPRARRLLDWLEQRFPDQPLHPDTTLQGDLGIDSLSWVDLSLDIEGRVGVSLDEETIAQVGTVGELVEAVEKDGEATGEAAERRERTRQWLWGERERYLKPAGPLASAASACLYGLTQMLIRPFFRLRVVGRDAVPETGPLILAPNHVSDLDPFVLGTALPYRVMRRTWWSAEARRAFGSRAGRTLARVVHMFPVDDRAPAASLEIAGDVLDRGHILVWFPEEWRSPDGELLPFRPGIGALIARTGARVLPCCIEGTFEAMPRNARLPRPRPVTVAFGEPVAAKDLIPDPPPPDDREVHRSIANAVAERLAAVQREVRENR